MTCDASGKDWTDPAVLLQAISKFLVWLGGSIGALTVILTAVGFVVEDAYLARFGVPRSFYEAKPTEYISIGGNFVLSVPMLFPVGAGWFALDYWWLAGATAVLVPESGAFHPVQAMFQAQFTGV